MKLTSIMACLALSAGFAATAKEIDLAAMDRDVSIFENVLSSALKHDLGKSIRQIEGYYLKHQGVVFNLSVRSENRWFSYTSHDGERNVEFFDFDSEQLEAMAEQFSQFGEDVAAYSKEALRATMENARMNAEEARRAAEQEREVNREIRDLERERRDLDFAQNLEDKESKAELKERLKELESRLTTLQTEQQKLSKAQTTLKQTLAEQRAKQQAQKLEAEKTLQTQLRDALSKTLCDYGAGLKSLPADERVSFVISGVKDKQKQVQVFSKEDIMACISSKITAEKLQSKADIYSF